MAKKVIIDCDMGTDDAVGLCMMLFDNRLDILAITATEGCVTADQANNNLHAIIGELDPHRYPRIGSASPTVDAPAVDTRFLYGSDGLGNAGFESPQPQHVPTAEKIIIDLVRAHPEEVTIICLGPLTNVARALQRDPHLAPLISEIIIVGGSTDGSGNISPCAEFNFYFDPISAREVLKSRTTKTLIPFNITRQVTFGFETMDELPGDHTRVGFFIRQILPHSFRAYRQQLGMENIVLNDAVGTLALTEPQLFETEVFRCDVETEGELTRGMLVIDRRTPPELPNSISIATAIRADAAKQYLLDLLMVAGNLSQ